MIFDAAETILFSKAILVCIDEQYTRVMNCNSFKATRVLVHESQHRMTRVGVTENTAAAITTLNNIHK